MKFAINCLEQATGKDNITFHSHFLFLTNITFLYQTQLRNSKNCSKIIRVMLSRNLRFLICAKKSKTDHDHIATVNPQTNFVSQNSHHCLVSSENKDKLIGLVGINNLAIIDTPKALLISSLDSSHHVRDLVIKITSNQKIKHFFVDDEK